jgi:LysM repeat protein
MVLAACRPAPGPATPVAEVPSETAGVTDIPASATRLPATPTEPTPTPARPTATAAPPTSTATSTPLPSATAAPPTATPSATTHTVQAGETLFRIALRYGVTVEALKAANGLVSDAIFAGQVLVIPPATGPTAPPPATQPAGGGATATLPPQVPSIVALSASAAEARPGDTLTIQWTTAGATEAWLIAFPANEVGLSTQVPPNGSQAVTISATGACRFLVNLIARNAEGAAHDQWLEIRLPAAAPYFFRFAPDATNCATGAPASGPASVQSFERGRLLWAQSGLWASTITALFDDGTSYDLTDTWASGDPETDPALEPPAGLLQPTGRLGKAWRGTQWVRERLGWATGPQQDFAATVQRGLELYHDTLGYHGLHRFFVQMPDGRVLRLSVPERPAHAPVRWDYPPAN